MTIRVSSATTTTTTSDDTQRDIDVVHWSDDRHRDGSKGGCWTDADNNDVEHWSYNVVSIAGGVLEARFMSWSELVSGPSTRTSIVDDTDDPAWSYVIGGSVGIGPGSWYTDDTTITLIDRSVANETDAREWIEQYEGSDNPRVMWQICYDGNSPCLWAHRLRFMHQNLDADTGRSPKEFATSTSVFLSDQKSPGRQETIYVRSDGWWTDYKSPTKYKSVHHL